MKKIETIIYECEFCGEIFHTKQEALEHEFEEHIIPAFQKHEIRVVFGHNENAHLEMPLYDFDGSPVFDWEGATAVQWISPLGCKVYKWILNHIEGYCPFGNISNYDERGDTLFLLYCGNVFIPTSYTLAMQDILDQVAVPYHLAEKDK